jgi:thymidylate synthase (FAD)
MSTVKVLDHGFVTLRNIAGPTRRPHNGFGYDMEEREFGLLARPFDADDRDPAQAARMSFDQMNEDRTAEQDHKLADYLMRNWHTSPFEMVDVWLEMKLPIFVARQFVRHRTTSINEVSGRYVTLPAEWYIPEVVGGKAANKKQGQEDNLDQSTQDGFRYILHQHCKSGYEHYLDAIKDGVAPEHARMLLSLNHYTHWLWKQDLHNLLNFLRLRDHSHAQIEAQKYAQAIDTLLRAQLPKTMELYDKYRRLP